MISKGDLVKMRLSIRDGSEGRTLTDMVVLGKVINYCEEEKTYIVEPKAISIPKEQVQEVETLAKDFDFDDVSMELSIEERERTREEAPEIKNIRISRSR